MLKRAWSSGARAVLNERGMWTLSVILSATANTQNFRQNTGECQAPGRKKASEA